MLYEGIQHASMFRVSYTSRPNHLPNDLNEESVISLGVMLYDTKRQILKNNIYI